MSSFCVVTRGMFSSNLVIGCYGSSVVSIDDRQAKKIDGYLGYQVLTDPSETLQG